METSPEDIEGMKAAQGILTARGGMTSHAAVVARGMGTCCVSGCGDIKINEEAKTFELSGITFKEGDYISLDGNTGKIYNGDVQTEEATVAGDFGRIMEWADQYRVLKVRTNADTPKDAKQAYEFGAEGIGLCRTEHMFFAEERIKAIRESTGGIPLVLHGGTGIPDDQVRAAIKAGVRKMNIGTDVCCSFAAGTLETLNDPDRSLAVDLFMKKPIEEMKELYNTREIEK